MTREIEWRDAFPLLAARVAALEQWHRDATARPPEVGKVHGMMHSAPEPVIAQPREDDGLAGLIEGMRKAIEGTGFHGGVDSYWPALARHVQSLIAAERRRTIAEALDCFIVGGNPIFAQERIRALGDAT